MADSQNSTAELLDSLRTLKEKNKKAISTSTHIYPASIYAPGSNGTKPDRRITSWKLTEHMFFLNPSPFPVLARGLFTESTESGGEKERIVARGYDKFFNTDEVDWTYWPDMARYTDGPYHLTLKTNGCLILVAALSETELVVASKHSLGTVTEAQVEGEAPAVGECSHAESSAAAQTKASLAADSKFNARAPVPEQDDVAAVSSTLADLSVFEKPSKNAEKKAKKLAHKERMKAERAEAAAAIRSDTKSRDRDQRRDEDKEGHRESQVHAEVGRQWLHRMLVAKGLSEEDLARRLWAKNWTAVFELCDDDFEEHVIATPAHQVGLNLHGLNHNTPRFDTESPSAVAAFAKEFGFIPTPYIELPTLLAVKEYTNKVAETGAWEGDMIEGFVVRARVRETPRLDDDEQVKAIAAVSAKNDKRKGVDHGKPPYAAGAPFFFKVKFEEPYLLYRTWREITRTLLPLTDPSKAESLKGEHHPSRKLGTKTRRPEAALYAEWCQETMATRPELFAAYDKGVVRVREAFLAWTESEGRERWEKARAGTVKAQPIVSSIADKRVAVEEKKQGKPDKWVIAPVAVPGCGKTMVGVSLAKLFGVGHTQSDDIATKKTAPTFLTNITKLLADHDVVFADRNNHIEQHYSELVDLNSRRELEPYNVHTLALVWDVDDLPYHRVLRLCSERVVGRGENHQTLRADLSERAEHESVVAKFIRNFTVPVEGTFSRMESMRVESDPQESVSRAVEYLVAVPGLKLDKPTPEAIREAVSAALGYTISTPPRDVAKTAKPPRYYGIAPEIDLEVLVRDALAAHPSAPASEFFNSLVEKKRITPRPHITLVHEKTVEEEAASGSAGSAAALWETCKSMQSAPRLPLFEFDMGLLIWDGRAMTLSVENLRTAAGYEAPELKINVDLRRSLHVTVGTAAEDIPAYESRALVWTVRGAIERGEKSAEGVQWIEVGGLNGQGRIRGMS